MAKIETLSTKSSCARDHLDHIRQLVEKYKQAVLTAAFAGRLTADWRKANSVSPAVDYVLYRQIDQNRKATQGGLARDERSAQIKIDRLVRENCENTEKFSPVPSSWTWTVIGAIFGVYVGATPSRKEPSYWNGTIPWVSSGEVAFCRIRSTQEIISHSGLANTSTRLHPCGTVLVGMIGEGRTRGQAAILDIEAANNQNCAAIRVSEACYSPEYVYWYFWLSYAHMRTIGSGNNQQALNKERVQRIQLPLAPPDEAEEIVRRVEGAFAAIDRLAAEASSARALLDRLDQAILAKAFRGELVPQDPNDEPASVLLARIRAERAAAGPGPKRGRRPRAAAGP